MDTSLTENAGLWLNSEFTQIKYSNLNVKFLGRSYAHILGVACMQLRSYLHFAFLYNIVSDHRNAPSYIEKSRYGPELKINKLILSENTGVVARVVFWRTEVLQLNYNSAWFI